MPLTFPDPARFPLSATQPLGQPKIILRVVVVGGSGRSGARICSALRDRGHRVTALGRSREALNEIGAGVATGIIDLNVPATLAPYLAEADVVVGCAHGRFIPEILTALDQAEPAGNGTGIAAAPRLILMGSTRSYMKIPDEDGAKIRRGEEAFLASGRRGVILHCSMIYGHADDRNVGRVVSLLRRWPKFLPLVVPLPGGGKRMFQPVHIDDVVSSVVRAVEDPTADGAPIILAGATPLTYAQLVRHCSSLLGRNARCASVPLGLLTFVSDILERAGLRMPLRAAEWRRATEDKKFDIAAMTLRLGIHPRSFADGIARSWADYCVETTPAKGSLVERWARRLVRDGYCLYRIATDRRVPWRARFPALVGLSYLVSPIDLIPDDIPVFGYLDDFVVVALAMKIAIYCLPAPLTAEYTQHVQRA